MWYCTYMNGYSTCLSHISLSLSLFPSLLPFRQNAVISVLVKAKAIPQDMEGSGDDQYDQYLNWAAYGFYNAPNSLSVRTACICVCVCVCVCMCVCVCIACLSGKGGGGGLCASRSLRCLFACHDNAFNVYLPGCQQGYFSFYIVCVGLFSEHAMPVP